MKKIIYGFILFCAIPTITFAYIDPGTGNYIIQLIAGVFFAGGAGVLFFGKSLMKKLLHPFSKNQVKDNQLNSLEEEKEDE